MAWAPLGWQAQAFAEIEPFPSAVLAHHYPSVQNLGDITQHKGWPDATFDVLVGGTPCQSFSVAGLRKGLADPRGNLMLAYLAIADRYRPEWLVWENVPGVLSSWSGADETGALHAGQSEWEDNETSDFYSFLCGLSELGYGWAYRSLDAQYAGLAQRRERVFVVASSRSWRRAAAVLFERHSLQRHPAPSREAGEGVAPTISARTKGSGGLGTDFDCDGGLIAPELARCVATREGSSQDFETTTMVAHPLLSKSNSSLDHTMETYVAHSLRADGFDASEDGTGRGTPLIPIPFDTTQITSVANYSNPQSGDPCHPLAKGQHVPAIAFSCKDHGADVGDIAPTLRSMNEDGGNANAGGQVAVAFNHKASANQSMNPRPINPTLEVGKSDGVCVAAPMMVRRLTPMECERLQGFPDRYTLVPYRGKPAADGPRYKALGNSMAVPVVRWIGQRIAAVSGIEFSE